MAFFVVHMLNNFKIIIEYDGTCYHGWQRQKNERTIQGEIENVLKIITGGKITLTGSGRTDAGVHALGQVANFYSNTKILPDALLKGINSLTPGDIVIKECRRADENFHARYNSKTKTYMYRILNRKIPAAVCRRYAWFIRKKLDLDVMQAAIRHIIGTHDFKSFKGGGASEDNTTRCVTKAELIKEDKDYLNIIITGNGFLRFMVRNIVGTLVDVGLCKITPDDLHRILQARDRNLASATAPPCGLFLICVKY